MMKHIEEKFIVLKHSFLSKTPDGDYRLQQANQALVILSDLFAARELSLEEITFLTQLVEAA